MSALLLAFAAGYLAAVLVRARLEWLADMARTTPTHRVRVGFGAWLVRMARWRWASRDFTPGVIYSTEELEHLRQSRRTLRRRAQGLLRFLGFAR